MALTTGLLDNIWDPALCNALGVIKPFVKPAVKIPEIHKVWEPQPGTQALAIAAQFIDELLFGGARGGGKSDYLLGDFLQDVGLGAVWRGIIFRKSYSELEELLKRAKEIFIPLGAIYKVADRTFIFTSGAELKLRYLETEADADNYQGHQYTWIGWDELGNWVNLNAYRKLKACLRSAHDVPFKRIRCSANPGGPGHHAVKAYFIDPAPGGKELIKIVGEDTMFSTRMFIPSRVTDNKILLKNDPGYVGRLRETGSAELVKAWLDGDWNVITGAYFPEFSSNKHVLEPFAIPDHWLRFRSMDWGSSSPFAVLWHAVSDGYMAPDGVFIPSGAIVTYRELYGCIPGQANVGVRWAAERIAQAIKQIERNEKIQYGVIDPSAYKWDGGPSHAERMANEGVYFTKADNNRIGGWDMTRARLCGIKDKETDPFRIGMQRLQNMLNTGNALGHNNETELDEFTNTVQVGTPMWYCFKTCVHLIRTLPALQHDLVNAEDCDTDGEDHAPDSLRYGLMSRPWTRPKPNQKRAGDIILLQEATLNDIWDDWDAHEGRYVH